MATNSKEEKKLFDKSFFSLKKCVHLRFFLLLLDEDDECFTQAIDVVSKIF